MKLLSPLHNILLWASALFFLSAFITLKKTLDIHYNSVVYIVPFSRIFMLGAVLMSIFWLIYTYTNHRLFSKKLYKVHIIGTIILLTFIIAASLWSNPLIKYTAGSNRIREMQISAYTGNGIVLACLLLTSIQLLYPLNLIFGIFKSKKS